jgi:hypothetical protein
MSQKQSMQANLEHFHSAMKSESEIIWQRHNYFLIVASVLLLALSQFRGVPFVQVVIMLMGGMVSIAWLLVTHRASKYIEYFKKETRRLENQLGYSNVYSESVKGREMRKVLYMIPLAFLFLWGSLLLGLATGLVHF